MKKIFVFMTVLFLLSLLSMSQKMTLEETVAELNEILKDSLYETQIEVDKTGEVIREDNNGNYFKFNLKNIEEVYYDFDGFNNVILKCADDKSCIFTRVGGKESYQNMNVIAFRGETARAIELFEQLIELVKEELK